MVLARRRFKDVAVRQAIREEGLGVERGDDVI